MLSKQLTAAHEAMKAVSKSLAALTAAPHEHKYQELQALQELANDQRELLEKLGPPAELDSSGLASLDQSLWANNLAPEIGVTGIGCCMMTSTTLWFALSDETIWERLFQVFVAPRCGQPPREVTAWHRTVQRRWLHSCMLNVTISGGDTSARMSAENLWDGGNSIYGKIKNSFTLALRSQLNQSQESQ